jgi:hypothetical protein
MSQITFNDIIAKLKELGDSHVDIKTNYRWNFAEFDGDVRPDTVFPLMTYEGPDVQPAVSESSPLLNFTNAFNILGMQDVDTSDSLDETAQNQVLNNNLVIALEVVRKLKEFSATPFINDVKNNWYGIFDLLQVSLTKVGPVTTDYLYGYRCEFVLNPKFSLAVDGSKWG